VDAARHTSHGGESIAGAPASGSLTAPELAERTKDFTGRAWVFERLDAWVKGTGDGRAFLLTGGPGSGKSAIGARLAQMSAGEAPSHPYPHLGPGAIAYAHFCRALDVSLDPLRFVEGLSTSLAVNEAFAVALLASTGPEINIKATQHVGTATNGAQVKNVVIESLHVGNTSPRVAFDRIVRKPLEALYSDGFEGSVLVLVDGLDEALTYTSEEHLVALLDDVLDQPGELPGRVRFVLASRPDPRILAALGETHLDLEADAPPDTDDVRDYAHRRLAPIPEPARSEVAAKVARAGGGNFLYARYVVDSLLAETHPEDVDPAALRLPKGLKGHYREFVRRELARDRERWEDRYRPVLGVLSAARGEGLTPEQIGGIVGLPEDRADDAIVACNQYLVGPDPGGRYRIYHQSFRDFLVEDSEFRVYPAVSNQRIAAYFIQAYREDWARCMDSYALSYTPVHLIEAIQGPGQLNTRAELEQTLSGLLTNIGFLEARTALLGIEEAHRDLRLAFELLPEDIPVGSVLRVVDLEGHNLHAWDRERMPAFFAQQVRNRGLVLGFDEVADAADRRLQSLRLPYWRLRWRSRGESAQLERTLTGHDGPVRAVAISADGLRAVSGSTDGTLRVWNLADGNLVYLLSPQASEREEIKTAQVRGWTRVSRPRPVGDTEAGRAVLFPSKRMNAVGAVALTADGRRALSGSRDGTVRLWDIEKGQELFTLTGHTDSVMAVAITDEGHRGVSGSWDGTVRVWDLDAETELFRLSGHEGPVLDVALSPEGRVAVSGSWDRTAKSWDVAVGQEVAEFRGHDGQVSAVAITRDGDRILTGSRDKTVRLWDVKSGRELRTFEGHRYYVEAVALTADGHTALSASWDRTVKIWDVESGRETHTLTGHEDQVWAVAASATGTRVVSGSWDRTVKVWKPQERAEHATHEGHADAIDDLAEVSDGHIGISGSRDRTARIWDLENGRELHVLTGHAERISAVALRTDATMAVTGSWDGTLKVWDPAAGDEIKTLRGHRAAVLCLVISQDGDRVLSGSWDHELCLWDLANGKLLQRLTGHTGPVWRVALLPNNRAVSASNDFTLRIWSLRTGETIETLHGHRGPVTTMSVTPDGQRVVSGSQDLSVRAWNPHTGDLLWSRDTPDAEVIALSIVLPNRVIAGARDGRLRVWTLEDGGEAGLLQGHPMPAAESTAPPMTIRATSSGSEVVTGAFDRRLARWDLDSGVALGVAALDGAITTLGSPSEDGSILVGDAAGSLYYVTWNSL
jgi:WD40 repeat protein